MGEPVPRPTRLHGGAASPARRSLRRGGGGASLAHPSMAHGLLHLFFAGGHIDRVGCGELREEDGFAAAIGRHLEVADAGQGQAEPPSRKKSRQNQDQA
jgi:hypothetical protein